MPEFQFIGKPTDRVDALEKVLGTAKYVADYTLANMLVARTLRSTVPHARILKVDVSAALKIPGVVAAITCEDFVDNGRFGYPISDMFMLAYQRVRYAGDGIVCIAAENEDALDRGCKAIIVDLEELPGVFDPMTALDPATTIVSESPWDAKEDPRGNLLTHYIVRKGDPQQELALCPVTLEEDYTTMHQEHAYLETEGVLAVPVPEKEWCDRLCPLSESLH